MVPFSCTARGVKVSGWRVGEGERVLSTHGWLDNANSWKPVAQQVSGLDWASFDFPGHGRSGHIAPGETYHFVDNVETVQDVANGLAWAQFSLVGHSMGGSMALMFAAAFPSRVKRLVLADSLGPITAPEDTATEQLTAALKSRRRSRVARISTYPQRQDLLERIQRGNSSLSDVAAELLLERNAMVEPDRGWRFSYDRRLRDVSAYRFTENQVLDLIRHVECPVLLLRASYGTVLRDGPLDDRIAAFKDIEVVEVEGSHHVHLVEPEKVAGPIEEFLRADSAIG